MPRLRTGRVQKMLNEIGHAEIYKRYKLIGADRLGLKLDCSGQAIRMFIKSHNYKSNQQGGKRYNHGGRIQRYFDKFGVDNLIEMYEEYKTTSRVAQEFTNRGFSVSPPSVSSYLRANGYIVQLHPKWAERGLKSIDEISEDEIYKQIARTG